MFLQGWREKKTNFWYCGMFITIGDDTLMKSFRYMIFAVALSRLPYLTAKLSPRAFLYNLIIVFSKFRELTQQISFIKWFLDVLET